MARRCAARVLDASALPAGLLGELAERIAQRAAEIVLERLATETPAARWLTGARAAADYLGCSPKRVFNRLHEIPHVREGGRVMFNTAELDAWLRSNAVP